MRIRWNGSAVVRRVVGQYEWSTRTGFVQDVTDDDLALELLTEPGGKFVAEDGDAETLLASGVLAQGQVPPAAERRNRRKRAGEDSPQKTEGEEE